jgi:hypothetical protein
VPSPAAPVALSPEEILAALESRIRRLTVLAADLATVGHHQEAAAKRAEVVQLRDVLDRFRAWLVASAHRREAWAGKVIPLRGPRR